MAETSERDSLLEQIRALTDALARERALFSGGPVVVFRWVAQEGWPVEYVSPNVSELFGWSEQDFLSGVVSYARVIHPEDIARVSAEVSHHSHAGATTFEQDYRILHSDGTIRWLYDCTAVVRDTLGVITHYDGYVLDISARREAEAAVRDKDAMLRHAQKMEALGRLAGGVAHDFNNILTAILGHAELVRMHLPDDSPALSSVDVVLRSSERAANLTRQLLAFSRRQALEPRPTDAVSLVSDTLSMLRPLLGEQIILETELCEPLLVRVDRTQLEQVVVNLVVNARNAMPSGGVIGIMTDHSDLDSPVMAAMGDLVPPGSYARLTVCDTGVGMDKETLQRIFEPFFTTSESHGTGLGLSTVYGIVRQSNGYVRVESEPGRGSRFEILLPLDPSSATPTESSTASRPSRRGSETILLVEDNEDILDATAVALRARGYDVIPATDGLYALEAMSSLGRPIHLLITDVVMPRLGGIALVERLVAMELCPAVLFISGYTESTFAGSLVPHAVLQKPFTVDTLLERVRSLLGSGRT